MSLLQKISEIEAEIARTQKNKATEHHLGLLKAKLAKLKTEVVSGTKGPGGKAGDGFDVTKSGDVRVGMVRYNSLWPDLLLLLQLHVQVGFPSVGKSSLLTKLTGTASEVAAYEFTTLTCIPGTLHYRGAKIQLLDMPGIIEGAKDGKGRGRQVIGTARTCDVILVVLDAAKPLTHKRIIERELEGFGIRLNKQPPHITVTRKERGGVVFRTSVPQEHLDEDLVRAICHEYKLGNVEVFIKQPDATADDLIDVIEGSRVYTPCLYVLNKIDSISIQELDLLDKVPHYVPVSAHHGWGFDELLERIWEYSGCIR
jgi:small GTP-binding protein